VLSWLNAVEFSKVTDEAQRRKADSLLNDVARNVFWLNPNFFTVGKNEGPQDFSHSDVEFAAFYLTSPPSLFTIVHAAPNIRQRYDKLADLIVSQLEWLRGEYDSNSALRSAVASPPTAHPFSRGTQIIARELIGRILKDKPLKLNRNNAIDLGHAVVSVSYCDYVLLDVQWEAMVNEMRRKFTNEGARIPIAKVFSKRANGVEAFLTELESGIN
jgi:hypothetical protein